MTKLNFIVGKARGLTIANRAPSLLLISASLFLLPACALVKPMNSASMSDITQTSQRDIHYKFESRNPIFANLGQYDGSLNSSYMKNRNAMVARPVREDARSRFAPKSSSSKSLGGTSLNSFLNTYSEAPQIRSQHSRLNSLQGYDFSQFDKNGFEKNGGFTSKSEEADIAFVNVKGKTDTQDWDACARESQGVFDQSQTGFELKESFSTCMRQRGYQPEDEAVETMMTKAKTERMDETPIATYPSLKGFSQIETKPSVKTKPQTKPYLDVLAGGL